MSRDRTDVLGLGLKQSFSHKVVLDLSYSLTRSATAISYGYVDPGGAVLLTRPISLLLAAFIVVATLIFHHNFADPMQIALFLKDLSMAGGFIALAVAGAGSISLDARLRWRA